MAANRTRVLRLALVAMLVGCASGGSPRPSTDSGWITREEIRATHHRDAFELVRSLRPLWTTRRGAPSLVDGSVAEVVVYVDGVRLGGWSELRGLPSADVETIRFLSAREAQARYGLGHRAGAILVSTRRG